MADEAGAREDARPADAEHVAPLRRNTDFLILWSADAVSALGTSMSVLVFPIVGYAISHSTVLAGLAPTGVFAGDVLTRLPAGALVDRWPRGRVLVVANVGAALAYASLAAAALAFHLTIAHLVIVAVLSGAFGSFLAPATSAAVRTVVPVRQLPAAYSGLQARNHAAQLAGPPLGGALYAVARALPFLVDAASYAVAAAVLTRLRTPLPPPPPTGAGVVADVKEGLAYLWRERAARAIIAWGALVNFAMTVVLVVITLRLVRAGVHPAAIGTIDTIASAAALLGAIAAPALIKRVRTGAATIVTGLVVAAVTVPMAWTTDVVLIGGLLALASVLVPANTAGISAYLAARTPHRLQGRLNSAAGFVAGSPQAVAPVLAGVLLAGMSGRTATLVGAALAAFSLLPLVVTPEVRRLGRPDTWVTA